MMGWVIIIGKKTGHHLNGICLRENEENQLKKM
jgi:hypothetical protein